MKRSWIWIGAATVAAAFLFLSSVGVSASQLLVFLLVLLCPLLHLFGMHGHGGGHKHGGPGGAGPEASLPDKRNVDASDRET